MFQKVKSEKGILNVLKRVFKKSSSKKALDKIIHTFTENPLEIDIKNNISIPNIFYVGLGKSGSTSLMRGLDITVAHWHSEEYFERNYNTRLLSENNLCLYDLIIYIGKRFKFKPLIIEAYREPVARRISFISQEVNTNRKKAKDIEEYIKHINSLDIKRLLTPYSIRWKNYFGVDLIKDFNKNYNYYFNELKHVKLLFLKTETSYNWEKIFGELGYLYKSRKDNTSKDKAFSELHETVLEAYKLSEKQLDEIYSHRIIKALYSGKEIQTFKDRWMEK